MLQWPKSTPAGWFLVWFGHLFYSWFKSLSCPSPGRKSSRVGGRCAPGSKFLSQTISLSKKRKTCKTQMCTKVHQTSKSFTTTTFFNHFCFLSLPLCSTIMPKLYQMQQHKNPKENAIMVHQQTLSQSFWWHVVVASHRDTQRMEHRRIQLLCYFFDWWKLRKLTVGVAVIFPCGTQCWM